MKARLLILALALVASLSAQQPTNVQKGGAAGVNNITADLYFPAARELRLSGIFSGTPASGALNLSNLTLTLPAATSGLFQPIDADLTSWATVTRASGFDTFTATPSGANLASLLTTALPASKGGTGLTALAANVVTLLGAADYSAMRTQLGLVIGTNVQAYDADLDDLADGSLTGTKVAAATTSAQGAVELATTAEALAGTDTARAPSVSAMEARALQGGLTRQIRDALYYDGVTSTARSYQGLGTAGDGIGTAGQAWSVLKLFKVPTVAATRGIWMLASTNGGSGWTGNGMLCYLYSTDVLRVDISDSSAANRRFIGTSSGIVSRFAGQWIAVAVIYDGTATKPAVYINGALETTAELTAGTAPAWNAGFADDYFVEGGWSTVSPWHGSMAPGFLVNGALTAAELLEWTQTGRLPNWCEIGTGSAVAKYTSDFSAGVNGWSAEGSATLTADTVNNRLDFTWAGSGTSRIVRYSVWGSAGRRYRLTFDITNFTGGNVSVIEVASGATPFGTVNGNGSYALEGTLNVVPVGLSFLRTGASGSATVANFKITELGPIARPIVQPGVTLRDAGSNNLPGILTSGITPLTSANRGTLTATLTWAGTHEGKSLLGAKALPTNAIITRIWRKATAGSSGSGCTIGTTTSATRWQALDTYTTAAEIVTLANQLPAGTAANDLDIVVDPDTANYTGSITVTVEYQIVGGTP